MHTYYLFRPRAVGAPAASIGTDGTFELGVPRLVDPYDVKVSCDGRAVSAKREGGAATFRCAVRDVEMRASR